MTNEAIKKLADELSFNVGWENIRVLVTIPYDLDNAEFDPAFKGQILDWLKGNGTEPAILACTGVKLEIFGITTVPFNETEPIVRMIPHDQTGPS